MWTVMNFPSPQNSSPQFLHHRGLSGLTRHLLGTDAIPSRPYNKWLTVVPFPETAIWKLFTPDWTNAPLAGCLWFPPNSQAAKYGGSCGNSCLLNPSRNQLLNTLQANGMMHGYRIIRTSASDSCSHFEMRDDLRSSLRCFTELNLFAGTDVPRCRLALQA